MASYSVPCVLFGTQKPKDFTDGSFATNNLPVPTGKLSLVVDNKQKFRFSSPGGLTVALVNGSNETFTIRTFAGILDLYREAKDSDGTWKPIEFLRHGDCGNSFGDAELPKGRYWYWFAKTHQGTFRTKVRFCLRLRDSVIYSNEYDDRIDKGMFTIDPKNLKIGGSISIGNKQV